VREAVSRAVDPFGTPRIIDRRKPASRDISGRYSAGVRVQRVMQAQQVFAIVVAVGHPHDDVNVLAVRLFRIGGEPCQVLAGR